MCVRPLPAAEFGPCKCKGSPRFRQGSTCETPEAGRSSGPWCPGARERELPRACLREGRRVSARGRERHRCGRLCRRPPVRRCRVCRQSCRLSRDEDRQRTGRPGCRDGPTYPRHAEGPGLEYGVDGDAASRRGVWTRRRRGPRRSGCCGEPNERVRFRRPRDSYGNRRGRLPPGIASGSPQDLRMADSSAARRTY